MKDAEDMERDRRIEVETDDEENDAEGIGGNEEEIYDDGYTSSSANSSSNPLPSSQPNSVAWPQSYRQSIDVYSSFTPSISFLGESSLGKGSSFLSSSPYKRSQASVHDSTIRKPLIPPTVLDHSRPHTPKHSSTQSFPFLDLPPTRECSSIEAILNAINVMCGVGLLSMPYALSEGGWLSLLALLIYAAISCYTGVLLKECLDSSPRLQTYPDIGQAAFGITGRIIVAIILYMELYASAVEYIILMSDNLSSLFPNINMDFLGVHLNPHYVFAITTTLLILPTVWLRNLSVLSYLSAGGVIATIFVVICLFWVGVVDQIGFHPSGTALNLANLPVTLGIYGFCYAGHPVFPNIYSSMKEPSKFPAVLVASFSISTLLYVGVSVCGFLMFGPDTQSQFTLNMPQNFTASKIAVWTTVVNPLCKYALTMTPVALSLEELWPKSHMVVSVLIRTLLTISTLVVALSVPFFSYLMALIGSFFAMLVALIFPCVCYLKIYHGRLDRWKVALCMFIIIVGVACACFGTYSSMKKIVDSLS